MKRVSQFQQKSRVRATTYRCRVCDHLTRETGDGEESVELCAPCYRLSGLENTQSDCGVNDPYLQSCKANILADIELVEKRAGAGAGEWRAIFSELLA